jgi:hypothetical protein
MITKRIFTLKYGDPSKFFTKGQCYDSGISHSQCAICHRSIRFCYNVRNPQDKGLVIGVCCFRLFRLWNSKLYWELESSKSWLQNTVIAKQRDQRRYKRKALKVVQKINIG